MATRMQELIALAKARAAAMHAPATQQTVLVEAVQEVLAPEPKGHYGVDRFGKAITWNEEQWSFISSAVNRQSCILIGAAGTGKTTTMRSSVEALLQKNYYPAIDDTHKHLPSDTPGVVCVSYTRRAVLNLRKALPENMKGNCITIHKLLEYGPVFYQVVNSEGKEKTTMRFEPGRGEYKKLSENIKTIIIDEASMVSVSLFYLIWKALPNPHAVQFIFLGDIQQLPPIFGSAILGFKMLKLPCTELTQVYRQALESPIIRLAHRILSGTSIPRSEFPNWCFKGQLTLHPWKKKISAENALAILATFFSVAYDESRYLPDEDMILIPYNVSCGTDELNKHIATHVARKNKRIVWEVLAGFNYTYFAVGDKVLYEKEDAIITHIGKNPLYFGKWPQAASQQMDYWGSVAEDPNAVVAHDVVEVDDIDAMMQQLELESAAEESSKERVRAASHEITLELAESGAEVKLSTAADINALCMAYVLTVHKSQGSEWRKVFLCLHQSHAAMVQRELLYTAVTRAKEELYVICEPDTFEKGIKGQRIKGNTLAEKAEFFKGKLEADEEGVLGIVL